MQSQKYNVNQQLIGTILAWVRSGEIAIPEIQRPFVWDATKVRDLMDSLYQGYPVGYIIAWKNPHVRLKDGTIAEGKKILIDGQQRVTALTAAILGQTVLNQDYRKIRIQIAFHPLSERFEVLNPAIARDQTWLPDIATLFEPQTNLFEWVQLYCTKNDIQDINGVYQTIHHLQNIVNKQIGMIELDSDLDIETVTEIFIRINSKGVPLSQADFAMSKIAVNETHNGPMIRKCIDYFCHLSTSPESYDQIKERDMDFAQTPYFAKMTWLKNENDDLYDPDYTDLLRVAFASEFNRGKLSDLVSLLSGRNFETRSYEEEIVKSSFESLERGILQFINENNFKRFIMIIKSAGFISDTLIRSKNSLNVAYMLYLKLRHNCYSSVDIERYVKRWFVLSILTGRYSGSAETVIDSDIKNISSMKFDTFLQSIEQAILSSAFWDVALVQNLDTSSTGSPYFQVFLASQVKEGDKGFLSKDITVANMIQHKGDIHHIFPKDYLKKLGLGKKDYNQVANYVYLQSEINIKIGNKAPNEYMTDVVKQCSGGGGPVYGGIQDLLVLNQNLEANCIPQTLPQMDYTQYNDFLVQRRKLMAKKIERYYFSL